MLERKLANYFKEAEPIKSRDFRPVIDAVICGLQLERGLEDRVDYYIIEDIAREISAASIHAGRFLRNPGTPNFELIYPWGDKPMVNSEGVLKLADADISYSNPYGVIGIAPVYLEAIADYKAGGNDLRGGLRWGNEIPPKAIAAHEDFHIGQLLRFPEKMEVLLFGSRSVQPERGEKKGSWESTWAEKEARRFEKLFSKTSI